MPHPIGPADMSRSVMDRVYGGEPVTGGYRKHTVRHGVLCPPPPPSRDALDRKGPQRQPQKQVDRRLEEAARAVGGGSCRLQMPLKLALAVRQNSS